MEYRQTVTGTARHALQLPDHDPESTSVDLLLEDEDDPTMSVGIGQLIRRERHADVYAAYWRPGGVIVTISEARAFILEGVAGKLRRHRKRCMQRLKPRTLATMSLRGAEVIVYKTSSGAYVQDEDSVSDEPSPSLLFQNRTLYYKREAARIQPAHPQRRKKAFDQQRLVAYLRALNVELNRDDISMDSDLLDAFRAALLLYIFFDEEGNRRSAEQPYVSERCIKVKQVVKLIALNTRTGNKIGVLSGADLPLRIVDVVRPWL